MVEEKFSFGLARNRTPAIYLEVVNFNDWVIRRCNYFDENYVLCCSMFVTSSLVCIWSFHTSATTPWQFAPLSLKNCRLVLQVTRTAAPCELLWQNYASIDFSGL
jgi:hypothetical protein